MAELEQPGKVFGDWDAPITDDDERIDPPIGQPCIWCQEPIKEGDNGRVSPVWLMENEENSSAYMMGGYVEHRECSLRNVMGGIGHLVDHARYCHGVGPDAGLSRRKSALLVWDFFRETKFMPSNGALEKWRNYLNEIARV